MKSLFNTIVTILEVISCGSQELQSLPCFITPNHTIKSSLKVRWLAGLIQRFDQLIGHWTANLKRLTTLSRILVCQLQLTWLHSRLQTLQRASSSYAAHYHMLPLKWQDSSLGKRGTSPCWLKTLPIKTSKQ